MSVLAAALEEAEIAEVRAKFPDFAGELPEEAKYWSYGDLELFFGSGGQVRPREAKAGAPSCVLLSRLRQRLAELGLEEATQEYRSFCRHFKEHTKAPWELPSVASCTKVPRAEKAPALLKSPTVMRSPADWEPLGWTLDFWAKGYGKDWWQLRARSPRFEQDRKAADSLAMEATVREYADYVRVLQRMDPLCSEESALAFPRLNLDGWCPFVASARSLFESRWRKLLPKGVKDLSPRWIKLFCSTFRLDWQEFLARFFKFSLAPPGSVSRLHKENHGAHIWFAQLEGRRLFFLVPPSEQKRLFGETGKAFPDPEGYASDASPVDIFFPNQKRHGAFSEAKVQVALLEPGDILLLPCNWWHYSVALTAGVTLRHPFWNLENRGELVNELRENFLQEQMPPEAKEMAERHLQVLQQHILEDDDSDLDD